MNSGYSVDFLNTKGSQPLAAWLIEAALARDTLTYGQAKERLQKELNISGEIFSTHMGSPAGRLIHEMHSVDPNAPLLNVILVRQADGMPGEGAGGFMATRFARPKLANKGVRESDPKLWRRNFEHAASEVYAYSDWKGLFKRTYGTAFKQSHFSAYSLDAPTGETGQGYGKGGEGPKHKKLRRWVLNNPSSVCRWASPCRSETEVVLKSADRVDVVYYGVDHTTCVEVKSISSNDLDLERGIYQCIKYEAVMRAMDPRRGFNIRSVLVTERKLPNHLAELARRHSVFLKVVGVNV